MNTSHYRLKPMLAQEGFTFIELLIVFVLLSLLAAISITAYNGSHTKGQAAYVLLKNMGEAAQHFAFDTGCYPTEADALFLSSKADNGGNSCGIALGDTWQGPYINTQATDASGNILKRKFGNGVTFSFTNGSGLVPGGNGGTQHAVVASNLPASVALKAAQACGLTGGGSGSAATTSSQSSCAESTPSGGTANLTFVYATGG